MAFSSTKVYSPMKFLDRIYTRLGFNAMVSEDHLKAEKYFLKIRKSSNEGIGTNHNLGMVYLASGDFKKAEICFLKEIEKFGNSYSRCKVLADLYYAMEDCKKSLIYYKLSVKQAAKEPDLLLVKKRLKICANKDDFRDAVASCLICKKGVDAERDQDLEKALGYYRIAIQKDPTNVQALNNAGACYERKKDLKKALKFIKRAYELSGMPAIGKNLKNLERAISSQKDEKDD